MRESGFLRDFRNSAGSQHLAAFFPGPISISQSASWSTRTSGVIFYQETIELRKWNEPDHFYLKMPTGPSRKDGGLFAVGFARGDIGLSRSDEQYNRIMGFIGKNKLTVDGDCYEEYPLNELSIPNPADYLV